jgi:hypothetical protein
MFYMILAFQSCYVGSTKCTAAVVTKQPETSEIVGFAEGILDAAIWRVDGKELGGDNLTTVLKFRVQSACGQNFNPRIVPHGVYLHHT